MQLPPLPGRNLTGTPADAVRFDGAPHLTAGRSLRFSRSPKSRVAFTLIELLAVLAIIGIVTTLLVPATTRILNGSNLTQGAQMVEDQIGLARQAALSRNHLVEVRFYQYGDPSIGESLANPASGKYRALQSFLQLDSGAFTPLGNVQSLPSAIIIDQGTNNPNTTLSSLLSQATATSPTATAPPIAPVLVLSTSPQTVPIPRAGTQYNSVAFQFRSDGSTNLPSGVWFLTIHSLHDGDGMSAPPNNFSTLQLDPSNGQTRNFRP